MTVQETGFGSSDQISPHNHQTTGLHEFHYFLEGEGSFWNAGAEHPVKPGTIFFSRPDEVHRARANPVGGRFLFYYLLFHVGDDQDLLEGLCGRFGCTSSARIGRAQAPLFEEIRRRYRSTEPLVRRSADYRLLSLVCDLAQPGSPGSTSSKYIDEALRLMQASLHTGLELDDLASRLGIDKSYFIRLFRRSMGVPPMRYFLGLRLDSAKHRLRNGDESLRTIALDTGFHDEFHFSHQFKAHVGISPQAFRHGSG